jgi:hypothetical protein
MDNSIKKHLDVNKTIETSFLDERNDVRRKNRSNESIQ